MYSKEQASFNFIAAITICSDLGAKNKIKSATVSTVSPSMSHEVMGPDPLLPNPPPWYSPYCTQTNHLMPPFKQEFSLFWGHKNWLPTHVKHQLSLELTSCSNSIPLALPGLSGGWPSVLAVHMFSLLSVLNKSSLPSEMLCVWKFFSNPRSDCLNSWDSEPSLSRLRFSPWEGAQILQATWSSQKDILKWTAQQQFNNNNKKTLLEIRKEKINKE